MEKLNFGDGWRFGMGFYLSGVAVGVVVGAIGGLLMLVLGGCAAFMAALGQ